MPVYNAEKYLEKAVDSIINQTLSFKDNVVIHLIDDSSSDGSLELCNKYKAQYPDNFIVTHFEENQGVSAVRNYGITKLWKQYGISLKIIRTYSL